MKDIILQTAHNSTNGSSTFYQLGMIGLMFLFIMLFTSAIYIKNKTIAVIVSCITLSGCIISTLFLGFSLVKSSPSETYSQFVYYHKLNNNKKATLTKDSFNQQLKQLGSNYKIDEIQAPNRYILDEEKFEENNSYANTYVLYNTKTNKYYDNCTFRLNTIDDNKIKLNQVSCENTIEIDLTK